MTIFVCAAALFAQPQPPQASTAGLEPAWEIAPVLEEMGNHAARLLPILAQVDVKLWMEKGASATYADQLQSSQDQAKALADGARALARNPEKLSASLELSFRIEGLENMLASLVEGLRKYQSQDAAQQLASVDAEGGANRERLRRYIVNLAAQREQQFEAMDREAQRCRGMLAQPAPPKTSGRKK
jgi:hypothetical protein